MSNSPESLHELPQPFDISTAVSLALRFNSPCTAVTNPLGTLSDFRHQINCAVNRSSDDWYSRDPAKEQVQQTTSSVAEAEMILPGGGGYVGPMEDTHYPQMELDAWSDSTTLSTEDIFDSEAEQLDRFCKYIDSTGDDDIPEVLIRSPPQQHGYLHQQAAHYCQHNQHQLHNKKKKRVNNPDPTLYGDYADEPLEKLHGFQPLRLLDPEPVVKCPWRVELANWDLWQAFDQIGTEMVITKNGRRMFPSLSYTIAKLQAENSYTIKLNILPVDSRRYKFLQTEWVPVGRADKKSVYKEYVHPDSPNPGSFWMDKPITFKLVKLTNNKSTTYSDQITQLKIENNPYARAFRESIPSDGHTPERKGGHCKRNGAPQKHQTPTQPSEKPLTPIGITLESTPDPNPGYSLATSGDLVLNHSTTALLQNEVHMTKDDEYNSNLNFWTDDDSLYTPMLLTPPMLSFSDTYLHQPSNADLETAVSMDSPLRERLNTSFIVDVESVDDDVFECS
ncbi:hypothetical protein EMCRGX_G020621 [Ephydatia muelleri]